MADRFMSEKIEDRIAEKEAELAKMKYNKATQAHFGTLKAQISQLRSEINEIKEKRFRICYQKTW
jgi:ribosome-interacting GTPase 1